MPSLSEQLEQRRRTSLYRVRTRNEGGRFPEVRVDGRTLLSFCSNDYLGLANHPALIDAMQRGAQCYGVGSGSAHLVTGHSIAHHALEEELAEFTGRSRALLFSTGYMANLGVISALTERGDRVFEDRLNHASLLDGALLSRARLQRYLHRDCMALEVQLARRAVAGRDLIVTDGVFSMDGDLAPLPELTTLAAKQGGWLMVDDAHGLGVLGQEGGGVLSHFGLSQAQAPVLVGTFGKAFGSFGAFVAGSEELIETLIQRARSYIYTTAAPPALAEATRASLQLVRDDHWRRERLFDLIAKFRQGAARLELPLSESWTPIQPLLAGSAERALIWSQALREQGILVSAIRPPTVPEGSARLRLTLSAAHSDKHLQLLMNALANLPRHLAP